MEDSRISVVAGFAAGMAEVLVGYPFDTVKTRLQIQDPDVTPASQRTPWGCAVAMFREEGLGAFYRGIAAPMLQEALGVALLFGARDWLHNNMGADIFRAPVMFLFGCAVIGLMESVIYCPLDHLKARLQAMGGREKERQQLLPSSVSMPALTSSSSSSSSSPLASSKHTSSSSSLMSKQTPSLLSISSKHTPGPLPPSASSSSAPSVSRSSLLSFATAALPSVTSFLPSSTSFFMFTTPPVNPPTKGHTTSQAAQSPLLPQVPSSPPATSTSSPSKWKISSSSSSTGGGAHQRYQLTLPLHPHQHHPENPTDQSKQAAASAAVAAATSTAPSNCGSGSSCGGGSSSSMSSELGCLLACARLVMKARGVVGLYLGFVLQAFKEMIGNVAFFGTYDIALAAFSGSATLALSGAGGDATSSHALASQSWLAVWPAGILAGMAYYSVGYPFDTIKSRLQTDSLSSPRYRNSFHCALRVVYHETSSILDLFRGLSLCLARALPGCAIEFFVFEAVFKLLMDLKNDMWVAAPHVSAAAIAAAAQLPLAQPEGAAGIGPFTWEQFSVLDMFSGNRI